MSAHDDTRIAHQGERLSLLLMKNLRDSLQAVSTIDGFLGTPECRALPHAVRLALVRDNGQQRFEVTQSRERIAFLCEPWFNARQ